ncbi:MAG: glycosyltransferase [Pseudomonadota bacterium]
MSGTPATLPPAIEPSAPPRALVIGTFPPIDGAAAATSVSAVARLLEAGYAVETVSASGHGDAHLALDFQKTYALRRFRAALRAGPPVAWLVVVPGALVMRQPDRLARAFALLQQLFTLLWIATHASRVSVDLSEPGDRARGWAPAAAVAAPLLRLGGAGRLRSLPDTAGELAEAARLASVGAASEDERTIAAGLLACLSDTDFLRDTAAFRSVTEHLSSTPRSRALTAALRPCPRWAYGGTPQPAWMTQLRAARAAIPRLGTAGPAAGGVLRRWALTELSGDSALAGMAATLRAAASPTGATLPTGPRSAWRRPSATFAAWAGIARSGALTQPLLPSTPASAPVKAFAALLPALAPLAEQREAKAAARPYSELTHTETLTRPFQEAACEQRGWATAEGLHSRTASEAMRTGTTAPAEWRLTPLGLAIAFAAGLPGGLPAPGRTMPEALLSLFKRMMRGAPDIAGALGAPAPGSAARQQDGGDAPLFLIGHANRDMGLGANLAMTADALATAGVAATALSADNGLEALPMPHCTTIRRHAGQPAAILHLNADRVPPVLLHRRLAGGRQPLLAIGFLLWEFERLPEAHALAVEMLHEIWAPTPFVAEAYAEAAARAGTTLRVMGKAVLDGPVAALNRATLGLPAEPFLFLASFDMHSSVERKNPLALVRAFQDAFPTKGAGASDVALAIKTTDVLRGHWGDPHDQWRAIEAAAAADSRIRLLTGRMTPERYRGLLALADVYVSTHRAEGFGYGPAEAMLRGKPVIVTDWSGTRAFCTERSAFPVPCRRVPVRPGETILPVPGAHWADIDHDALVATLRRVREDPEGRDARAAAGADLIRREYGLTAHAQRLSSRLEALGILTPVEAGDATLCGQSAA